MSSSPKPVRTSTYRVTNQARQQRILRAIERVADPAITALGATTGDEFFIVAECSSATADMHVRRIVVSLDLSATRMPASKRLYDETPPSSTYAAGLGLPRFVLGGLRKQS
ncbi:hypothetical protein GCM10022234_06590 [Aeromicrobium panaciterrae]|uniref:hypothetical protein n=1 Tax=Aeromicrobium panaciterrae TaxID=363861 RepID=UPI0031DE7F9B